jgi:Tol biopolymer transport system component
VALVIAVAGTLVVVRAFEGSDSRPLTARGAARIVFSGGGGGEQIDLFSMNPDGSDVRRLTDTPASEEGPAWSPEGSRIVFAVREPEDTTSHVIGVMDADGANRGEIAAPRLEGRTPVASPTWSPDGNEIAFAAYGDGGGIYVAFVNGGPERRLTSAGPPTAHVDSEPEWSRDGGSIVFIRWTLGTAEDGNEYQILRIDAEGGEPTVLARFAAVGREQVRGLSWSPDGSRLAYTTRGGVHLLDPTNGDTTEIVACEVLGCDDATEVFTDSTSWAPDGLHIAFTARVNVPSARADPPIIYVATLSGDQVSVASTGVGGLFPAWQPVVAEETTPSPSPTTPPIEGSISAIDGLLPEGELLFQVDDQVELLEEGAETSTVIGQDLFGLDLSPDGSRALVSAPQESDTPLLAIDLSTGEPTLIADLDAWTIPARWSPDGSSVAIRVGERNILCLRDLAIEEPRCLPELGRVFAFDWSPDGSRIVFEQGLPGSLTILDVETGQTSVLVRWDDPAVLDAVDAVGIGEPLAIQFQGPQWSSSGRYVAALGMVRTDEGHSNVVLVFDLNGGVVARGVPLGEFSEARGWSPAADVFAYAAGEPPYQITEVRLLDVSTGEDRLLFPTADAGKQTIHSLVWSPTGRWVAVVVGTVPDGGYFISEIQVLDTAGADPPRIFETSAFPELVDWGP